MYNENSRNILTLIATTEHRIDDKQSEERIRLTIDESTRRKTIAAAALWRLSQGQVDQAELILDSEPRYLKEIVYDAVKEL